MPDVPEPTSRFLTKDFYKSSKDLVYSVCKMKNLDPQLAISSIPVIKYHDVPGSNFTGPF